MDQDQHDIDCPCYGDFDLDGNRVIHAIECANCECVSQSTGSQQLKEGKQRMKVKLVTPPVYLSEEAKGSLALLAYNIIDLGAKKVTKYISPREVIKATRVGRRDRRSLQTSVLFTIGRPNYAERGFIKRAQKIGVPFPIREPHLRFDKKKKQKAS